MSKSFTSLKLLTIAGLAAGGLAGCAVGVTSADGTRMGLRSAEFAQYAEGVFRLQNEMLDALAFALEDHPDDAALIAAEDNVLDACAGLNDVAVRRQRGEGMRPLRGARAVRTMPECEAAAIAAAELLASREG
jgi:hypothetical protein